VFEESAISTTLSGSIRLACRESAQVDLSGNFDLIQKEIEAWWGESL